MGGYRMLNSLPGPERRPHERDAAAVVRGWLISRQPPPSPPSFPRLTACARASFSGPFPISLSLSLSPSTHPPPSLSVLFSRIAYTAPTSTSTSTSTFISI